MRAGELRAFRLVLVDRRCSHRKLWFSNNNLPAVPQAQERGASKDGKYMSSHQLSFTLGYSAMSL